MDGVEAGWHPDPEGRHELRYWNGNDWTEHVSNQGVTSVAPLTPVTVAPVAAPFSVPTAPDWGTGSTSQTSAKKKPWGLIGLGVVIAAAVAGGLVFLVGGGDSGGGGNPFRTYELAIDEGNPIVAVRLELDAGQAFRFRAIPGSEDLDLVVSIAADQATTLRATELDLFSEDFTEVTGSVEADELSDFFTDSGNAFSDSGGLESIDIGEGEWWEFDRSDFGGTGNGEASFFAAPAAGEYLLIIGSYDGEDFGSVELTIEEYSERFDFEASSDDLDEQFSDAVDFFTDADFFSDIDFTD